MALKVPITLRGGFQEDRETEEQQFIGARGAETVQPVAQKAPSLTKDVDTAKLSTTELQRYDFALLHKQTVVTATVELAGPPTSVVLNENNLLAQTGTALGLPVKVKLSSVEFLGENCYVGSDADPINIGIYDGDLGNPDWQNGNTHEINSHGAILTVVADTLVDNSYAAPGVEGCGVEGGADEAINAKIGLPSLVGQNTAIIDGSLKQAGTEFGKVA